MQKIKKRGEGVEKKGGGGWGPPINPKKTIKPLKFMNEITLKMNGRNPKKADYQGASYHGRTDRRTDGRTNERTSYFFLPFPKTKPLVPRGKDIQRTKKLDTLHRPLNKQQLLTINN